MGNGNNIVTEKMSQKVNKILNMYQHMRSICNKILE